MDTKPVCPISVWLCALTRLRAAVDAAHPVAAALPGRQVHGWRDGATIFACHPAARAAFDAAHAVADAGMDRIVDRAFGQHPVQQCRGRASEDDAMRLAGGLNSKEPLLTGKFRTHAGDKKEIDHA